MESPNLYQYDDYRSFLKDLYQLRKKLFTRYSYAKLSKELNLGTSNYFHMVIRGNRNLSLKALEKIEKVLKFSTQQKRYFKNLVRLNDSDNKTEQKKCLREIEKIRGRHRAQIKKDQHELYSHWYHPIVRELITLKDIAQTTIELSKSLLFPVNPNDIRKSLTLLERLGLIQQENGQWVQSDSHVTTGAEVQSKLVLRYHRLLLRLAEKALSLRAAERDISAMVFSLSKRQMKWLKQRLADFRDELQHELTDSDDDADTVAQLSLLFFPLATRKTKHKKQ